MNRSEDRLLPVPIGAPAAAGERRSAGTGQTPRGVGVFAAQLIGQTGQKRGLRGGPSVLQAARTAYLGAEYCGDYDRRPPLGLVKRTAI